MAVTPYADLSFASDYFGDRLGTTLWDNATSTTRSKALAHATTLIDTLSFISSKYDPDQEREFPRSGYDNEIPDEVKKACCEVALELLRGNLPETIDTAIGKDSESVGDASVTYSADQRDLYSENMGLPSRVGARLLSPWLRSPRLVRIRRV